MSTTAELEGLLGRLRETNVNAGLDLRVVDYLLGNFDREWYAKMSTECLAIVERCGEVDVTEALSEFARYCRWIADDRKTWDRNFRTSSSVSSMKEKWEAVEPKLRAYVEALPPPRATAQGRSAEGHIAKVKFVLGEMRDFCEHYKVSGSNTR
jgi:hypothetical protein